MTGGTSRPGWYPDVADPDLFRWWDGIQWTDQVAPHLRARDSTSDRGATLAHHAGAATREHSSTTSMPDLGPAPTIPAFRAIGTDASYTEKAQAARQGVWTREGLEWIVHTWVSLVAIQADFTIRHGQKESRNSRTCLYQSINGGRYRPALAAVVTDVPATTSEIGALVGPDDLVDQVTAALAGRDQATTPEARQHHAQKLEALGLPRSATSVTLTPLGGPLLPIVAACYQSKQGHRVVVWDASTGAPLPSLSASFTQDFSWAGPRALAIGRRL